MICLFGASVATVLLADAASESPIVKYNVALITGAGALLVSIVSALLGYLANKRNQETNRKHQSYLERLKAELISANQSDLEQLKSQLALENQQKLESIRAQVADQARVKDARLDYQYEAHKRLYRECEPLLFQLAELSQSALYRIYSLARTARQGHLTDWLSKDGYYKRSTLYMLVAPLVILRLIQRRLTFVDLTLDKHIAGQYALLRLLYLSFTDAFEFARMAPSLEYSPDVEDWPNKRLEE